MGNAQASYGYINDEFIKINQKQCNYLTLDQMLQFQPPRENPIDLSHLGTLYVMDKRLSGRFYFEDLMDFAEVYCAQVAQNRSYDFQSKFQAYCTLHMWNDLCKHGGIDDFVNWFVKLFSENMPVKKFEGHPDVEFLPSDTIKTMHQILAIKSTYGVEFQIFFDLMQRVAEEQGIMLLSEKKLDEVVPVTILEQFARDFINGFVKLMSELGFERELMEPYNEQVKRQT
eukprot:Phypoly_transcript_10093.p1 GENE.Phypoly_transcript_10093~~Phypoly_transcript_10093.p1  ORF type:complete len:228 (+),score=17.92 Phypoly_transcript_10093:535-1218(+)